MTWSAAAIDPYSRLVALLLMAICSSLPASAQDVVASFEQLQSVLREGDQVAVNTDDGKRTAARFESLSSDTLAVIASRIDAASPGKMVSERVQLSARDIVSIEREVPDSVLNGGLIGAAIAAGPGFWGVMLMTGGSDSVAGVAAKLVPPLAVGGFAAGALLDAAIHRHSVVFSRSQAARSDVAVWPLISNSIVGIAGRLNF